MKYILLFSLLIFSGTVKVFAQEGKVTKVKPFKPAKMQTTIGGLKDSTTVSVKEGEVAIAQPLKVIDAKGALYNVTSYHFVYTKTAVTEDEITGKVSPTKTIKSSFFKMTPLPAIWANTIREELKPGESFYFYDIIVKDAQGRIMYAPDLKISIR